MTESLINARKKLSSVLEIYTPFGAGRANAIAAMTATVAEFESAIREDERATIGADIALIEAQTRANDALARAHGAAQAAARPAPVEPNAAQAQPEAAPVYVPNAPLVGELVTPEGQRFDLGQPMTEKEINEAFAEPVQINQEYERNPPAELPILATTPVGKVEPETPGVNAPAARSGRKRGG